MDGSCGKCGGTADDGPVLASIGLICWFCADAYLEAARLPWGDPAADPDITPGLDVTSP